jgi:hypothetical protein
MLASAAHASPADTIGEATGAGLQANAKLAVELLKGVNTAALSDKDRKFVVCARERFGSRTPAAAERPRTFTDRALAAYQSYWHAALTQPETREQQEKRLDASLRKLLNAPKSADLDQLVEERIKTDGNHSLEGRTGLLRELMVWSKQDDKLVPVVLPEGQYQVKVRYLDGFKSFGWSHYATCGRAATGGWTTDDALFAVVPRYDSLDDEEFRVTFLGHETQHFADKARFKDLKPWQLEYRAKLVEIALADKTRVKVLTRFVEDQSDDPASPHSYADRKILNELVKRLQLQGAKDLYTVDLKRLQSAAVEALIEDSRRLEAAGALRTPSTQS